MEKYGKKCHICGEYFQPSEGKEIHSWESGSIYDSDDTKRKREYYDDRFLCDACYEEEFPGIPVEDDSLDTASDLQEMEDDSQEFE
jgi:hypothetical protein